MRGFPTKRVILLFLYSETIVIKNQTLFPARNEKWVTILGDEIPPNWIEEDRTQSFI